MQKPAPRNFTPGPRSKKERGQSIIIIAVAFIGILAFIGLAVDFGILLIGMGHLKRAVDSASLAAAAQYKSGLDSAQITDSANEFLRMNGVDLGNITAHVETCDTNPGDPELCTTPRRKLVRVTASADVGFVFLPVIGIKGFTISASSISEAAAMDVVLVIDISESMTYEASPGQIQRDPSWCNPRNLCEPFQAVKNAAMQFANQVLDPLKPANEDRLAIVIFSNGWEAGTYGTQILNPPGGWITDKPGATAEAQADSIISGLGVYTPQYHCDDPNFIGKPGLCLNYDNTTNPPTFIGMSCPWSWSNPPNAQGQNDYSTCTTTNIGGGLLLAGQMFDKDRRPDSLRVVILLTDGAANATPLKSTDNLGGGAGNPVYEVSASLGSALPVGYCPEHLNGQFPSCRDWSSAYNPPTLNGNPNPQYDADDYARDQALFVGCSDTDPAAACHGEHGQDALVFAIGLGSEVLTRSATDPTYAYGDSLLRYIAAVGDDGNPATDPCVGQPPTGLPILPLSLADQSYKCGNYYFAQYPGILNTVFTDISNRIYTRITH